jgi:hypothetical protein
MTTTFKPETRARLIRIPNPRPRCSHCGKGITAFNFGRGLCVVINRYEKKVWKERLVYHDSCYEELKEPFGTPTIPPKRTGHRVMGQ